MRFSLMIPVYNAEQYLCACVDSVLWQTFSDFELLLIDDGSTDSSAVLCDRYAESDKRVRVFHMDNGGTFPARRFAEKHARGEYLLHMDADDETQPELLQALNDAIDREHAELLCYDFTTFCDGETLHTETYFDADGFYTGEQKQVFYRLLLSTRFNAVWSKCFHRRLIDFAPDYQAFRGLQHGEDLLRSAYLLTAAESISYIHRPLYRYRRFSGYSGRFDENSLDFSDRVDAEVKRLIAQRVDFDESWQALFDDLCRKQLDNYLRLLGYSTISIHEGARILKSAMQLPLGECAMRAADDSLKYRLLRQGKYRALLLLYRGKRWRRAQ